MPVYKNSEMVGRYYTNFTIKGGRSNLTQLFIREATSFIQDQVPQKIYLPKTPDNRNI